MKDNDEYNLRAVLVACGAFTPKTLEALNEHLDKTLTVYLRSKEQLRANFATKATCHLLQAIMDAEDEPDEKFEYLSARINTIIDGYDELREKRE